MRTLFTSLALAVLSVPAFAADPLPLPEPGSLALVGIAGVALVVSILRNRRK